MMHPRGTALIAERGTPRTSGASRGRDPRWDCSELAMAGSTDSRTGATCHVGGTLTVKCIECHVRVCTPMLARSS